MSDVEEKQCITCVYSKLITDGDNHAAEYPMCWEIEGELALEKEPVAALDEQPDGSVVCTKYERLPTLGDTDD